MDKNTKKIGENARHGQKNRLQAIHSLPQFQVSDFFLIFNQQKRKSCIASPASTATSHVPHRSKRPSHAPCAKRSPATTGRPISPMPRKSGSASSTRAPICCCGSTSRNAVRRPARSTTTAPYGRLLRGVLFPPRRERLLLQLRMQLHRHAARRAPARPHAGGTCPCRSVRTVRRRATYPHAPLPETEGDNRWTLTLAIPAAALFRDRPARRDGVRGAMNLYKCGDDLSCPHYLSWRPVGTPAPDFHRPEFFEPVFFEPKKQ